MVILKYFTASVRFLDSQWYFYALNINIFWYVNYIKKYKRINLYAKFELG